MGEDSRDCVGDDEVILFLRVTAHRDCNAESLIWCRSNAPRYPAIAGLAQNLLAAQATSAPSESQLSLAGRLILSRGGCLENESMIACMSVRSWGKLIK